MLHGPFPLDGCGNVVVAFSANKPSQTVPLGEPFNQALAVFPRSARDITRYAETERAIGSVGHDVDPAPALSHVPMLQAVDARNKSGHDDLGSGRGGALCRRPRLPPAQAGPISRPRLN